MRSLTAQCDSNGCVGNDAAFSIYEGYYDDLQVLYMVGIQNRKMGNRGPSEIFGILMDLLTNCDTRATGEQRRAQHLARFEQQPWKSACDRVKHDVIQALPGEEHLPEMSRAITFVSAGDEDAPGGESMKINLPPDAGNFASGNGEGTWGLVHPAIKARSDSDEDSGGRVFVGFLDNNPG